VSKGKKGKKRVRLPAYQAIIDLMGGNVKCADRFLTCLYEYGYYIGVTKNHQPIRPSGKPNKAA
jgi:hypothetical protein